MSLKSKIEAVIYASEEPVTLQQLVGLLADEAQAELDDLAADQASLRLDGDDYAGEDDSRDRTLLEAGTHESPVSPQQSAEVSLAVDEGEVASHSADGAPVAVEQLADATDAASPTTSEPEPSAPEAPSSQASAESAAIEQTAAGTDAAVQVTAEDEKRRTRDRERAVRDHVRRAVDQLIRDYAQSDRGIEIREVASGFRMGTKPEYHDAVRGFVKSLKPALKLTLPALETLAVVAYKQPVTAAEITEIRGVDSAGVLGGLMARKLIATAGRKQVIGRPMLYKTTRDFLLRFGLKDVQELPSMDEFERMAGELAEQEDLPMENPDAVIEEANIRGDAEMLRDANSDEGASTDEVGEAEIATSNNEEHQNATAESAAGGNDEEVNQQHTGDTADGKSADQVQPETEEEQAV
jgi:segregation and condensation protein B